MIARTEAERAEQHRLLLLLLQSYRTTGGVWAAELELEDACRT